MSISLSPSLSLSLWMWWWWINRVWFVVVCLWLVVVVVANDDVVKWTVLIIVSIVVSFECWNQSKRCDYAEPSSVYDNNIYHEECLRCNACGVNLTGPSQKRARRFKNQIFCDLHFADVALMESSDFMQQLRSFKPQSLGCAVARRKSSTTLIFPLPPQACSGIFPAILIDWLLYRLHFSMTTPRNGW